MSVNQKSEYVMSETPIKSGDIYGKLKVIRFVRTDPKKGDMWECECACGKSRIMFDSELPVSSKTQCRHAHRSGISRKPQKEFCKTKLREYKIWQSMKYRCDTLLSRKFPRYSERGITVCDRWKNSFEDFYADMGPAPSDRHSIDRIDNDGNYEPNNCRWATDTLQALNRNGVQLVEHEGTIYSKTAAEKLFEIKVVPGI